MLRSLETLADPALIRGITREAVRSGGTIVQESIRANAPIRASAPQGKDNSLRPGELREGVQLTVNDADASGTVVATVNFSKKVRHVAGWIERGHRLVRGGRSALTKTGKAKGPGTVVGFVAPNPFARAGWESSREDAKEAVRAEIRRQVNKIRGR